MRSLPFIDLFAGLGGFHLALSRLGHKCVFASEINSELASVYEKNFGMNPVGDIRGTRLVDIPPHEVLCAGSPCQPFSKAGDQLGLECPKWGDLFDYILRILRKHTPKYVLFENVPNLERHNGGETWRAIVVSLERAGYEVSIQHLSPHQFGIPQIRERVFLVGSRQGLNGFKWPEPNGTEPSLLSVLDKEPQGAMALGDRQIKCLRIWQKFIKRFPKDRELPSFPIWSMEFGATYPFEEQTPDATARDELRRYRGSHGRCLHDLDDDVVMDLLPSYARNPESRFPHWKVLFIRQNRDLYESNKKWIREWLPEILEFSPSWQKLEWNCKGEERDIWKYVVQFRASGIRVKRPTTAPSLIAMTKTQVPIIAWEKRYMTPRECARLQSMEELELPRSANASFKALGNAVNAEIVELISRRLLKTEA